MAVRPRKRPRDPNQLAKFIVGVAAGDVDLDDKPIQTEAVAHGRMGGKTRADNLAPERRAEIARIAARKRWNG